MARSKVQKKRWKSQDKNIKVSVCFGMQNMAIMTPLTIIIGVENNGKA